MDLNNIIILKKIADFGSLTKAAQDLKLPKSAVSQRLSRLEEELGGRLILRSTRSLSLTEFGEQIYRYATMISEQREAMLDLAASSSDTSAGLIRMTAPPDLGPTLLRGVLSRFMLDNPQVRLELDLSSRYVDLANEGFHLALRATDKGLEDSSMIATKIHSTSIALFATPQYLAQVEPISRPDLLASHRFVAFAPATGMKVFQLKLNTNHEDSTIIHISPTFLSSNYQAVLEATKAGIGLGLLPEEICSAELATGALQRVLPKWDAGTAEFYVVYPSKKFLPKRVKTLIQYLTESW